MTSAINTETKSQEFREVTASEMEAVSGGWFAMFYYGLAQHLAAESQETKLLDFLSKQLSPQL